MSKEGDNIWGENVREELNKFKNYVEYIISPENNQVQQVEQGVHLTYHCTGSGRNESFTSTFVVVKSSDHQKVMTQHTKN